MSGPATYLQSEEDVTALAAVARLETDAGTAAETLAQWLRSQRQSRNWTITTMIRELRAAATEAGDKLPEKSTLSVMVRRWEKGVGGVSERYRMFFCKAFGIPLSEFGKLPEGSTPSVPARILASRNGSAPGIPASSKSSSRSPAIAAAAPAGHAEPSAITISIPAGCPARIVIQTAESALVLET